MISLLRDFQWSLTGVVVKKTGARVPFDRAHLSEIWHWCVYWLAVVTGPRRTNQATIGFLPDPLRPWYLLWPALWMAGIKRPARGQTPQVWMHFEDKTHSEPISPPDDGRSRWNFSALDLSKSAVAKAFEEAFGRSLALDPMTGSGQAVEKGEANGVHDGRIVTLPCPARPGKVYQRLIDNRALDGLVEDLRTPTLKGRPICVFIKRRPIDARFTNDNVECWYRPVESVFSAQEISQIEAFCRLLHLDWGGLDILRDAGDGQIYIVDANRTDMGPPIALPLKDKLEATRLLARALKQAIEAESNQHRAQAPKGDA